MAACENVPAWRRLAAACITGPKCDGFCEISPYFRTAKISVVAISSLINMSCKVNVKRNHLHVNKNN